MFRRHSREDDTPTGWGDYLTAPVRLPLPLIDDAAALRIERLMRHMPRRHRLALKFRYVYSLPDQICCRRLAVPRGGWVAFLCDAQEILRNLTNLHYRRSITADNSTPVPAEPSAPPGAVGFNQRKS